MSEYRIVQNNFTGGMIDPKLLRRTDHALYAKSTLSMLNAIAVEQGGVIRRFGTELLQVLPDDIYDENTKISYLQEIGQENIKLLFVKKGSTHVEFYLYNKEDNTHTQLDDINNYIEVSKFEDVNFLELNGFTMVFSGKPIKEIKYDGTVSDFTIVNEPHEDLRDQDYRGLFFKASEVYGSNVHVSAYEDSSATTNAYIFTEENIGGVFDGNGGYVKISSVTGEGTGNNVGKYHQAHGQTVYEFINTDTFKGEVSYLSKPIFTHLGYPTSGAFFEGRLLLCNNKARPSGIWMSKPRDLDDFDIGRSDEADGIAAYLQHSKTVPYIYDILCDKSLIAFTSNGIYSPSIFETNPAVTPKNFKMLPQNSHTSRLGVRPTHLDNFVFFVSGNSIFGLTFAIDRSGMAVRDVSILANNLIRSPKKIVAIESSELISGSFLLVLNSDYSLAMLSFNDAENVEGWSLHKMQGGDEVVDILELEDEPFLVTKRSSKYCLEKLRFDLFMDATVFEENTQTFTPNDIFTNAEITVIADGRVLDTVFNGSNEIDLGEVYESIQYGINFVPQIEFLPPTNGNDFLEKRRIKRASLDVYETMGLTSRLDSSNISDTTPGFEFNSYVMGSTLAPYTGEIELNKPITWDANATIKIEQTYPAKMYIRAIVLEVEE